MQAVYDGDLEPGRTQCANSSQLTGARLSLPGGLQVHIFVGHSIESQSAHVDGGTHWNRKIGLY